MASTDNVRVRYEEGLILGAAQLSGDQTYFRAALERRSLSRDMFGIAWGLELTVETTTSGPSSAIVWLDAGVAYGGDGKAIVVRERTEISSKLRESQNTNPGVSDWRIYLVFEESERQGKQTYQYCGQAMDPITTEGYRIEVEPIGGSGLAANQREGARVEPQSQLGAASDSTKDRVHLGIVKFDPLLVNAPPVVVRQTGTIKLPDPDPPKQSDLDADPLRAPAQADYIGLVGATIAHPRRWTSSMGKASLAPAIRLEPTSGIHLEEPTIVHANARVEGVLDAPKAIVTTESGVCVIVNVGTGVAAASLMNKAVEWDTTKQGVVAAVTPEKVLGIAVETEPTRTDPKGAVRVVVAGPALATVIAAANPSPGQWLILDAAGDLKLAPSTPDAGTLIAKALEMKDAQNRIRVLVSLA